MNSLSDICIFVDEHHLLLHSSIEMLDFSNWEVVGLAVDVVIVFFLNRYYRNKAKDAELVSVCIMFLVLSLFVDPLMVT